MGSWGEASTTTYENDIKEETHLDLHELLVPRRNVVDRVLLLCRVGRRGRRLVLLVVLAVLDHLLQRLFNAPTPQLNESKKLKTNKLKTYIKWECKTDLGVDVGQGDGLVRLATRDVWLENK